VVIDFIDMKDKKHQKLVEAGPQAKPEEGQGPVTVGTLSKFGCWNSPVSVCVPRAESAPIRLVRPARAGRIKRVDTLSLSLLRQISTQVAQGQIQEVRAAVPWK